MVFEKVRSLIASELNLKEEEITLASSLTQDLGADSLDAVELIMAIEDEFDVQINDEEAQNIQTVKDIVDFLSK